MKMVSIGTKFYVQNRYSFFNWNSSEEGILAEEMQEMPSIVDEHFGFSFVFRDVQESKENQTERKDTPERATS